MTDPFVEAYAHAYTSIPSPNRHELDEKTDSLESELRGVNPNYHELQIMVDQLTGTMGFRASSGEICDEFLAERGEQLVRILDIVGAGETEKSFPILRELVRGAYAASVYTRTNPDTSLYDRLGALHGAKSPSDDIFIQFKDVLSSIVVECKEFQNRTLE